VQPSTVKKHVGEEAGRGGRAGDQSEPIPGMLLEGREGLLRQLVEPLLLHLEGAGGDGRLSRFLPDGVELLADRTSGIAGDLGETRSGLQVGMGCPVLVGVFDEPLRVRIDVAVHHVRHQEHQHAGEDDPVGHPRLAAYFTRIVAQRNDHGGGSVRYLNGRTTRALKGFRAGSPLPAVRRSGSEASCRVR
jgi:hypothetical protein